MCLKVGNMFEWLQSIVSEIQVKTAEVLLHMYDTVKESPDLQFTHWGFQVWQ